GRRGSDGASGLGGRAAGDESHSHSSPVRTGRRTASGCSGEEGDGEAGDALAPAEGPEPLGPLGLDADGRPHHGRQPFSHGRLVGGQLRRFEDHRRVGIGDRPPGGRHEFDDPGQQGQAVGPPPAGVAIGEVGADVAETGGAEEGVGHGVGHDVGVAVPGQTPLAGQDDPAQDQRPPRVVAPGMDVEALPDPDLHRAQASRRSSSTSARTRSSGPVIFRLAGSPSTTTTVPPIASTRAASSVASPPPAWARRSTSAAKACGVWMARSAARSGVSTTRPAASIRLTVSGTGTPGTAPSAPARTAAMTRSNRSTPASGRAASWTTMTAASPGTAASPARTDSDRVAPPATTAADPCGVPATRPGPPFVPIGNGPSRRRSTWAAGTTATTPSQAADAAPSAQARSGRPPRSRNCFGTPPPKRLPDPPATTIAQTSPIGWNRNGFGAMT